MLADHLTEDDSVLVLQMCSLRTLRAVKAVSKRLRRLGREVICSPAWRSDEANLKELRMCMWTEGSFTSLEMVGHAALADVYGISLCNGVAASASWDGSVKIWDASTVGDKSDIVGAGVSSASDVGFQVAGPGGRGNAAGLGGGLVALKVCLPCTH